MTKEQLYTGVASLKAALSEITEAEAAEFEVHSRTLQNMSANTSNAEDIVIKSMTVEEVVALIGSPQLDYYRLLGEFAKLVPDVLIHQKPGDQSMMHDIMCHILYKIGPSSRSVKKGQDNDKNWKLRIVTKVTRRDINDLHVKLQRRYNEGLRGKDQVKFEIGSLGRVGEEILDPTLFRYQEAIDYWMSKSYHGLEGAAAQIPPEEEHWIVTSTIMICTYKNHSPPETHPIARNNTMCLTIKQASLAALSHLNVITRYAIEKKGVVVLTPLAGAIFSRDSVKEMFQINEIVREFVTMEHFIACINTSAQSGGHLVPTGRGDIAAVCALVATSTLKDTAVRKSIVTKTIKQYVTARREHNKVIFGILCGFATGGVPLGWDFDTIMNEMEASKVSVRKMREAAKETAIVSGPSSTGFH